ncbi:MAG: GIY-YIG nuclease family protein [Mariprofundaceae bacterium]|nr:GIY-YIG nuclease family protein [Mariprofundaceae bacterium]
MTILHETGWHLYLIRLDSGHLYTGITTDVARRFGEHRNGKGAKFLRGREGLELVFNRAVGDRSSALKVEAAVKKLPKQRKEALINGDISIDELLVD